VAEVAALFGRAAGWAAGAWRVAGGGSM